MHVTTCPGCCYNLPRWVSCNTLTHIRFSKYPEQIIMGYIYGLDITCHFGTIKVSNGQSTEVQ